ncbi:MAG TPA: hypothetical protein PK402_02760, partial [Tepidisphaeraceae bacterium]|nr:hypothetical protein [Tepidisphaeraceae bacterium]
MSDTIEPTPTEPNDPSISPEKKVEPKRKRSKLRWVWRGLGVFLVLILLLIVFAPKIASSGFARSFVLPKINSAIGGGELQISSWNFSWLGGQRVDGVRYLDENNALAIETNLVSGLSLWDAIRGDLNLKETRIDANVNLKVDSDSGKTNID